MYAPLSFDLDRPVTVDPQFVIDRIHPLWQRLAENGAQPLGDDNWCAVQVADRVGYIPYSVRRGIINAVDIPIDASTTLLDALLAGDGHPFWAQVGLEGAPYLWGAAAVLVTEIAGERQVLLGHKVDYTDHDLPATFGGLWSSPAGIVDVADFETFSPLRDALIHAAVREMSEETSLHGTYLGECIVRIEHGNHVAQTHCHVEVMIELARCKPQAFVIMPVDASLLENVQPNPNHREYHQFVLETIAAAKQRNLSPEAQQALKLLETLDLR